MLKLNTIRKKKNILHLYVSYPSRNNFITSIGIITFVALLKKGLQKWNIIPNVKQIVIYQEFA